MPKLAFASIPVPTAPTFISDTEAAAFEEEIRQCIADRAYQIFEESGHQVGNDDAHWRQAESEVLQHGIDVRESGSWLVLNATVPVVSAEDVQIHVGPTRVIIRAKKHVTTENTESQAPKESFLTVDLNVEVEPLGAVASFKNNQLSLVLKRRQPSLASILPAASPGQPGKS